MGTSNVFTHVMQYSVHVQIVEGRVNLDPWIFVLVDFEKNKGVTFHSCGRRLMLESLAPEVQAV